MTKLSPGAKDLIKEALGGDRPTNADRARIRAKLLARAGAAAAVGAAAGLGSAKTAGAAGAIAKSALSTAGILKVLGVLVVGGIMTAGVLRAIDHDAPREASGAAPALSLAAPALSAAGLNWAALGGEGPGAAPAAAPSTAGASASPSVSPPPASTARRAAPPASGASLPREGGSLEGEMSLLRKVQAELREGRSESALRDLDRYERTSKDGPLREERLAVRVLALCSLGRRSEARAEAQRFLAASPRSPVAERVRTSCGGEPPQ